MNTSPNTVFSFADGELHIRLPGEEMRLRWGPVAIAEKKNHRGKWDEFWPAFRLLRPIVDTAKTALELPLNLHAADQKALDEKQAAFDAFRASLPADITAIVERFGSHQWTLLQMLHAHKPAVDLAKSNPVLAYCLANNAEIRCIAAKPAAFQARCYCGRKQRWIIKWLGFPESEATVRLLKKTIPNAVHPSLLRRLRLALEDREKVMPLLAHHDQINTGLLELIVNPNLLELVTPELLAEVAHNQDDLAAGKTAGTLSEALSILKQIAPQRRIPPFRRIAQIHEFSAAADAEYLDYQRRQAEAKIAAREAAERRQREHEHARRTRRAEQRRPRGQIQPVDALSVKPFPNPPIPGTKEIIPITTEQDLLAEGNSQNNCVGAWGMLVRIKSTYVYRVMSPERATLSIVRGADGCWHRDQIKKAWNHEVRHSTKTVVDHWLAKHRVSV